MAQGKSDGTVYIDTRVDTKGFAKGMNNMQSQVEGVTGAFKKLGVAIGVAFGVKALVDFGKEAIDLASDLEEVQNVVDTTFGNMSKEIDKFSKNAITQFGLSELAAKKYSSTMGAMLKSMGIDTSKALEMSTTIAGLAGDVASFYNLTSEEAFSKIRSGISGETEPLKQLGINLSVANLEAYALAEGITKSYNAMTEQEKAMLRYNYLLKTTADAQGDFARTSNSWSNQLKLLTEQFNSLKAVLGKSFINIFKPIITGLNNVMKSLISFAETFSNALGKIFGWKYEVKDGISSDLESGADYADDTADGLEDAAKSANKLKNNLSSLDKLNVISVETEKETGGTTTGSGTGKGQWVEQDSIFKEFKSEIESLYELGDYISQTLSRMMEDIDWDSIYQKAKNFGKGLAEFLNGLISPRLFGNVGKTIASALNTAFNFLNYFGKTFDWKEFGESLAWGINDFFSTFDFKLAANTLNTFVNGFWSSASSFFKTLKWDSIIEGIGEFLGNLDASTILTLLGAANLKKVGTIISSLIGKNIGGTVPVGTETVEMLGTAEGIGGLALAFEALSFAIDACVIAAEGLIILDIIKDPMIDMLGSMTDNQRTAEQLKEEYKELAGAAQMLLDATVVPLTSSFNGLPTVMGGTTAASLAMSEAFDKIAEGTVYTDEQLEKMIKTWNLSEEDIESLRQAMLDANPEVFEMTKSFESLDNVSFETLEDAAYGLSLIKDGTVDAAKSFDEFRKPMWGMNEEALAFFETLQNGEVSMQKFNEQMGLVGQNISEGLAKGAEEADVDTPSKSIFESFVDAIKSVFGIHSPAKNMMPLGENIMLGVLEGFSSKVNSFTETMTSWYENSVQPWFTKEKWLGLYENIKTALTEKWNSLVSWWSSNGVSKWYNTKVKTWFTKSNWNFSGIKEGLSQAFNNAVESIKSIWSTFKEWIKDKLSFDFEFKLPNFESYTKNSSVAKGVSLPYLASGAVIPPKTTLSSISSKQINSVESEGIIRQIMREELSSIGIDVTFKVEGDPNGIFKVTQKKAREYTKRTGTPAYT